MILFLPLDPLNIVREDGTVWVIKRKSNASIIVDS